MDETKDIFLSYNWSIKPQVKKLYQILNSNYKVWLDERDLTTSNYPLSAQLANGIKKSKVFICCVTNDYCKSYNCNLEVECANSKAKPMVVLMVDKIDPSDIDDIEVKDRNQTSGIGFIIGYY